MASPIPDSDSKKKIKIHVLAVADRICLVHRIHGPHSRSGQESARVTCTRAGASEKRNPAMAMDREMPRRAIYRGRMARYPRSSQRRQVYCLGACLLRQRSRLRACTGRCIQRSQVHSRREWRSPICHRFRFPELEKGRLFVFPRTHSFQAIDRRL